MNRQINEAYKNMYLEEHVNQVFSDLYMLCDENYLTEANWLSKLGLHAKKGKGLLQYFAQFGSGLVKLIKAAVKRDTKTIKELMNTEIKKEEVIEFVMLLDEATLHILSTPLHFISATTGWHIGADMNKATETTINLVKNAYQNIKDNLQDLFGHNNEADVTLKDIGKVVEI